MSAPITPDERAAMRERAERLLRYGGEEQDLAEDTLRLLDALDAAEAEIALMGKANDALVHRLRTTRAERDGAQGRVRTTMDEIRRVDNFLRLERVAARRNLERAERAEAEVARHRAAGRVWVCASCGLAPEAHASTESTCVYVPTLAKPVDYDSLTTQVRAARPAPVWDEDTVRDAVVRALRALLPLTPEPALDATAYAQAHAALAVVRDHLPVRPDREDIYRAWHGTDDPWGGCADRASIERVLALFDPKEK